MKFARVTEMLVSVLDAGYIEYLSGTFPSGQGSTKRL